MKTLLTGTFLWAAALSIAADAQDMSKMMTMKPGAEMSEADKAYMTAMQGMSDAMMKTELTGDPEGDFVRLMIPHHQSAVAMAEALLKQENVDPQIAKMAHKIKADQLAEVAVMQKWLAANPQ
jgi:uncharacterized protein (DUF305 family)